MPPLNGSNGSAPLKFITSNVSLLWATFSAKFFRSKSSTDTLFYTSECTLLASSKISAYFYLALISSVKYNSFSSIVLSSYACSYSAIFLRFADSSLSLAIYIYKMTNFSVWSLEAAFSFICAITFTFSSARLLSASNNISFVSWS